MYRMKDVPKPPPAMRIFRPSAWAVEAGALAPAVSGVALSPTEVIAEETRKSLLFMTPLQWPDSTSTELNGFGLAVKVRWCASARMEVDT